MIESRTDEQRRKFMDWYNAEKADYGGVFDFRSQIVKYCQMLIPTVLSMLADPVTGSQKLSHITSFISLCPKTYAYETNTGRIEIKAKGVTQNGYTENILKRLRTL